MRISVARPLTEAIEEAIAAGTGASDLVIVDNQVPVARVILFPSGQARVAGLHAGTLEVSSDFDAPLSDNFWAGAP